MIVRFSQGEDHIFNQREVQAKNQIKTVGLLETSLRFQCPEKIKF